MKAYQTLTILAGTAMTAFAAQAEPYNSHCPFNNCGVITTPAAASPDTTGASERDEAPADVNDSQDEIRDDRDNDRASVNKPYTRDQYLIDYGRKFAEDHYQEALMLRRNPSFGLNGSVDSLANRAIRRADPYHVFGGRAGRALRDCGISSGNVIASGKSRTWVINGFKDQIIEGHEKDIDADRAFADGNDAVGRSLRVDAEKIFLSLGRNRDNHDFHREERQGYSNQRCLENPVLRFLYRHPL